jgi:GNAT superfamily N-acetyltransferase
MSTDAPPAAGSRPTPGLDVRRLPITHPDAVALVEEVQGEYVRRYGGPDATPLVDGAFDPPHGAFFVGYADGVAVATGGWRLRDDVAALGSSRTAEVKRMYVAPAARRTGVARAMLAHLEATARDAGAEVAILETGLAQPEAIGLYTSSGYEPIEKFGHYAKEQISRCFGRRIAS